jgi:hypothetical protein
MLRVFAKGCGAHLDPGSSPGMTTSNDPVLLVVIPAVSFVIPSVNFVIPDLIRDPVHLTDDGKGHRCSLDPGSSPGMTKTGETTCASVQRAATHHQIAQALVPMHHQQIQGALCRRHLKRGRPAGQAGAFPVGCLLWQQR